MRLSKALEMMRKGDAPPSQPNVLLFWDETFPKRCIFLPRVGRDKTLRRDGGSVADPFCLHAELDEGYISFEIVDKKLTLAMCSEPLCGAEIQRKSFLSFLGSVSGYSWRPRCNERHAPTRVLNEA